MDMKLIISDPKTGKTYVREVKEPGASRFRNLKLGQTFKGEIADLSGYEFEITGGSDDAGFCMRRDVGGTAKKKIPIVKGVGLRKNKRRGLRVMKTVAGNTVHEKTSAINVKIVKEGKEKLGPAEGEAKEASKGKKEEAK